jgi:glycopeptide antibiotics resistance protein
MAERERTRRAGAATFFAIASVAYVALVLAVTLLPAPWPPNTAEAPLGVLNPATWTSAETWRNGTAFEFTMNIAMFVPIGLIAARYLRGWMRILAPIGLTLAIEIVQIPLADRVSDPRDLIANTIGAILGLGITWLALVPSSLSRVRLNEG